MEHFHFKFVRNEIGTMAVRGTLSFSAEMLRFLNMVLIFNVISRYRKAKARIRRRRGFTEVEFD